MRRVRFIEKLQGGKFRRQSQVNNDGKRLMRDSCDDLSLKRSSGIARSGQKIIMILDEQIRRNGRDGAQAIDTYCGLSVMRRDAATAQADNG